VTNAITLDTETNDPALHDGRVNRRKLRSKPFYCTVRYKVWASQSELFCCSRLVFKKFSSPSTAVRAGSFINITAAQVRSDELIKTVKANLKSFQSRDR